MDNKEYKATRKKANVEYVNQVKEKSPCADCKGFYPFYVMEFDHLDGSTKEDIVSTMSRHVSRERIDAEIAKCELVCANCHAIRTYKRAHP